MYRKILARLPWPGLHGASAGACHGLARAFDAELHLLGIVTTAIGLELAEAGGTMEGLALEKAAWKPPSVAKPKDPRSGP